MKRNKSVLLLVLAALTLTGCDNNTSSSSLNSSTPPSSTSTASPSSSSSFDSVVSSVSDSTSSSATSSTTSSEVSDWSEEAKELLKKYCGEVLPYPQGLVKDELTVEEIEDYWSGGNYLQISDNGDSFTLEKYYETLVKDGWSVIKDYIGNEVQVDSANIQYVELTNKSADSTIGYDLVYYFVPGDEESETHSTNIIRCYNDMSATLTEDTEWGSSQTEDIFTVTTTTLPFLSLGNQYSVTAESESELDIVDLYIADLTNANKEKLVANGFKEDTASSLKYNSLILTKILEDGATISAMLYYLNGNNIVFMYTPNYTTYASWPKAITDEIKEKSGYNLPTFELSEGGSFYTYKKNGAYYIQGDLVEETYDAYLVELEKELTLDQSDWFSSNYVNWEETIKLNYACIQDEDTYAVSGIVIKIQVTTPTSKFSATWPTSVINSTIADVFKVSDYTLPEFDNSKLPDTGKKIKYEVKGEEYYQKQYEYYVEQITDDPTWYEWELAEDATTEEIEAKAKELASSELGIFITIKDIKMSVYENYEKVLLDNLYHLEYDEDWGNPIYEDKDGKVMVTMDSYADETGEGLTKISIKPGSGKTHTPVFEFAEDKIEANIGATTDLNLKKDMLPYDVTYNSDTEGFTITDEGEVEIADTVEEGTVATITASITVPSEATPRTTSIEVTAKKALYWSAYTAMTKIYNNITSGIGLTPSSYENDEDHYVEFDLSESVSEMSDSDIEAFIESSEYGFVLEGFEAISDEWREGSYSIGDYDYDCVFIDYRFSDLVQVSYTIYHKDSKTILRIDAYDIED